jgi:hypothetical protein
MWRHIPRVANGLTLQGGLELLLGVAFLIGGADSDANQRDSLLYQRAVTGVGPPLLVVGGSLKAFAANRNRRFVGRKLGLVALWSALPTATVWMCAPTGLALLAYGVTVYRDKRSREAFSLGESGKTVEEIHTLLVPQQPAG